MSCTKIIFVSESESIEKTGIVLGFHAREILLTGLRMVFDAVSCTLGPSGKNVIIHIPGRKPFVTKDGVTVAKNVIPVDRIAKIGADIIKESSLQTNEESGDGTTTAVILSYALCEGILRLVSAGHDSLLIKRGIKLASAQLLEKISEIATSANTFEKIRDIATISANNDAVLGSLVANAVMNCGHDGVVSVETSSLAQTTCRFTNGMKIDNRGYLSSYFVNNKQHMTCELQKPLVLVSDAKISSLVEIIGLLEVVKSQQRQLLIISDDISTDALQTLVINATRGALSVCAIKCPSYGHDRMQILNDIAAATGASLVAADSGITLKTVTINDLGECEMVIVEKNSTILAINKQNERLKMRLNEARESLNDPTVSIPEKNLIKCRIANMASSMAVISVGGDTELEMNERRDRIDDAVSAARAALINGIVPGGGIALVRCSRLIDKNVSTDDAVRATISMFASACLMPFKTIMSNAGYSHDVILDRILSIDVFNAGFNALTGKICDMIEEGIVDPVSVTLSAVKNASSIAMLFAGLECIVLSEKLEE